jgi:hypothetical protein
MGGMGLNIGIVTGSVYTSESSSPLGHNSVETIDINLGICQEIDIIMLLQQGKGGFLEGRCLHQSEYRRTKC